MRVETSKASSLLLRSDLNPFHAGLSRVCARARARVYVLGVTFVSETPPRSFCSHSFLSSFCSLSLRLDTRRRTFSWRSCSTIAVEREIGSVETEIASLKETVGLARQRSMAREREATIKCTEVTNFVRDISALVTQCSRSNDSKKPEQLYSEY